MGVSPAGVASAFVSSFEASADLLAAPFDECLISARLDDFIEVF